MTQQFSDSFSPRESIDHWFLDRGASVTTSFQFVAADASQFASLFDRPDGDLGALGVRRMTVDAKPGFPCRVSLADAEIGETVLLLPFAHHDVASPYRATGPIFVRQNATTARPSRGEVPAMLRHRLLSVRAYDADAMLRASDVLEGTELDAAIERFFTDERVAYLHIHNARPGCYNCAVVRT
jgi:Protein of unknown function (DUF1203)